MDKAVDTTLGKAVDSKSRLHPPARGETLSAPVGLSALAVKRKPLHATHFRKSDVVYR
jgi:hypothetical protein